LFLDISGANWEENGYELTLFAVAEKVLWEICPSSAVFASLFSLAIG
jgi:hypothetical protein